MVSPLPVHHVPDPLRPRAAGREWEPLHDLSTFTWGSAKSAGLTGVARTVLPYSGWMGLAVMVLARPCPTHAEPYAAGFADYGLSAQFSDVRTDGTTGSNLRLQNSPIFGLKVGYFLDNLKYLGGEAELYTATPYLKQQQFTQTSSGGTQTGIISGDQIRATTAVFNVVFDTLDRSFSLTRALV
jgi:hypothetical protein